MPAQKKHASTRARRNTAATKSTLRLAAPDETRPIPPLRPEQPRMDADGVPEEWLPITRQWWDDLWASPMSPEYIDADYWQLLILADLYDRYWRAPSQTAAKEMAGEIRLQRQAFGITPYDRRRLEWTIEEAETAKDKGSQRRQAAQRAAAVAAHDGEDPRAIMGAV